MNDIKNEEEDPIDIEEDDLYYNRARTMAPRALPRPMWEKATSCYTCRQTFGPALHRHHCRRKTLRDGTYGACHYQHHGDRKLHIKAKAGCLQNLISLSLIARNKQLSNGAPLMHLHHDAHAESVW